MAAWSLGKTLDGAPCRPRRKFPLSRTPLPRISPLVPPHPLTPTHYSLGAARSWKLEEDEKGDKGNVHVFVWVVLQVLREEPQSFISMIISYSLAAFGASPETGNDREEIPGKGCLQLCVQELGGKGRPEGCGMYEPAGLKKVGSELEFSEFLAPLQVSRRLGAEPLSQTAPTHLCTPSVLSNSVVTMQCLIYT